jgi:hypothetical protein
MAIAEQGSFLKGLKGSIWNITFRNVFGETVAQGKRAKGMSNPSDQVIQSQAAAGFLWAYFRKFANNIRFGWQMLGDHKTPSGAFFSENYQAALGGSGAPLITPAYEDIIITRGLVTATQFLTGPVADASLATVAFTMATGTADVSQDAADDTVVLIYNITQDRVAVGAVGSRAGLGAASISCPAGFLVVADDIVVHTYQNSAQAFGSDYYGKNSDSVSAITTVVA